MPTLKTASANAWHKLKNFLVPERPELFFVRWFLMISLPLCVLLPPFMGPDEASHVYRTYEFSRGDLLLDRFQDGYGYQIPDNIVKLNQDQFWGNAYQSPSAALKHNLNSGPIDAPGTTVQYFEATSPYTPLSYLHFIIPMLLNRLASINTYAGFILLRLANIALYAVIVYYAVRLMPRRQWFLAMAGLLPMAIHQATVVSPDGFTNALAFLSVALVARLVVAKRYPGHLQAGVLALALFLVSFSKQAYLFFPLILLIVPARAFWNRLGKARSIAIMFLAVWGVLGLWTLFSSAVAADSWNVWRARENFGETKSTSEFIGDLVQHPIGSAAFLTHSLIFNIATREHAAALHPEFNLHNRAADFTPQSFLGAFGSLMVNYPLWVYGIVVLGLALPLLSEKFIFLTDRRLRLVVWGLLALQFLVLVVGFWLRWTARTDPAIVGIQGRYLIPLLGLVAFLPTGAYLQVKLRDRLLPGLLGSFAFIQGAMLLIVVATRFYD